MTKLNKGTILELHIAIDRYSNMTHRKSYDADTNKYWLVPLKDDPERAIKAETAHQALQSHSVDGSKIPISVVGFLGMLVSEAGYGPIPQDALNDFETKKLSITNFDKANIPVN